MNDGEELPLKYQLRLMSAFRGTDGNPAIVIGTEDLTDLQKPRTYIFANNDGTPDRDRYRLEVNIQGIPLEPIDFWKMFKALFGNPKKN